VFACVGSLRAQELGRPHGFWWGFGLGGGWATISCNGCAGGPRLSGSSFSIKLGGTPSPRVRLGAGLDFWYHELPTGTSQGLGALTLSLYYYPLSRSGLFVEAGVGTAAYTEDFVAPVACGGAGCAGVVGGGWGLTLGVGYDERIGRTVSVMQRLAYTYGGVGNVKYTDGSPFATGWKQHALLIGLGVTLHKPLK